MVVGGKRKILVLVRNRTTP
uniref:Uncharacterized protein n=1 Tax=Anguilla anguilla TaxID=7936 RepID=A0A0E9VJX0_ANGAN